VTAIARIWRGLAGSFRRYSEVGSDRYWIFGTTKRPGSKRLKLRAIFATSDKNTAVGTANSSFYLLLPWRAPGYLTIGKFQANPIHSGRS